jgi:hypothetical protein
MDESKCTNNGIINKQKTAIRLITIHIGPLIHQTILGSNVWCGLLGGKLLGPYINEGTRTFTRIPSDVLPTYMDDTSLMIRNNVLFQLNGIPAHIAIDVREHL